MMTAYQLKTFVSLQSVSGAWCSWLAFLHGVQAVARSSRAAPTTKKEFVIPAPIAQLVRATDS